MERQTDILIVGAGLAGSAAALVLARQGLKVAVFDQHGTYPPDFRCEKLSPAHAGIAKRLGLLELIEPNARMYQNVTIARQDRIVGTRRIRELGLRYDALVNTVRSAWPGGVELIAAHPTQLETSRTEQKVTTRAGIDRRGRLLLMATGQNERARRLVGLRTEMMMENHTLAVGFNLLPGVGRAFPFESLTFYGEHGDRLGYVTFFPVDDAMRVNLFCYPKDQRRWIAAFRHEPLVALLRLAPGLGRFLAGAHVVGETSLRFSHLYRVADTDRDGVVLLGEAFQSTCPATGTGALCALNDVERLCTVHVPRWLAAGDMSAEALASFYRDPVKKALDERSRRTARKLRSIAVDDAMIWRARRALARLRSRLACELDGARRNWAA